MRVSFQKSGSPFTSNTDWKDCHSGSMNFYVAGMEAETLYEMNYEVRTGLTTVPGPQALSFTTGAIPGTMPIPESAVLVPPNLQSDLGNGVLLTGYVPMPGLSGSFPLGIPIATNLNGALLWYYPMFTQVTQPVSGGNLLMIMSGFGTGTGVWGDGTSPLQQIIREVDIAGSTVRETNADRLTEQLLDRGTDPIGRFHHDLVRLPNGNTIAFGDVQRVFPAGTQGSPVPVNILGLMIMILDKDWQVIWHWNAFDHMDGPGQLDINRKAVRGELCFPGMLGCPPVLLRPYAFDWLHPNSVQYVPADGNLLVSFRNQDWIVKIDYRDGRGDGDLLWRLGKDGDFAVISGDPYPWFSGQHDAGFESDGALSVFDNGTSRIMESGGNSRGQAWHVDEENRVVWLETNADLGVYGIMLGSAQRLSNGNYMFMAGFAGASPDIYQQSIEVTTPGEAIVHLFQGQAQAYRSWRMRDLYTVPE
jgi:hypothetical protein